MKNQTPISKPKTAELTEGVVGVDVPPLVVPLRDALALVDFGPCRSHPAPSQWLMVSAPMCAHCVGIENVDQAAGRIIAAEYRRLEAVLEAIEEIYVDGCDTYEDWKAMGDLARAAIRHNESSDDAAGCGPNSP